MEFGIFIFAPDPWPGVLTIKEMLSPGWELTKNNKWQYHKNPEAGSAGHQAAVLSPEVADSTKAVSGEGLFPARKQNTGSIIISVYHRSG
jgi:hypothetical protein